MRWQRGKAQASCPADTAVERGKNTLRPLRTLRHTTAVSRQGFPPYSRGEIEDDPIAALKAEASGFSLCGTTSFKNCYIDLALYDGDRSLDIIKTVLRKHRVPKQTNIHFFTSDHAEEVISS